MHEVYEEKTGKTGKYSRNGVHCNAKVIYQNEHGDCPHFCLIEKTNANWDKGLNPSFSIGWKCENKYFVLGLPTEADDIRELKKLIDNMASAQKND